jgi:polyhydroxyalkanoate synthesis regulator phasin
MDEFKLPPSEELWEMAKTFSEHAQALESKLSAERQKSSMLDTENSGWLDVYQRHLSEIDALKAEISRLSSRIRELQGGS